MPRKRAIYEPAGQAAEYAPLAANPYRGCGHECAYCYVPGVLKMPRREFDAGAVLRDGFISALIADARRLQRKGVAGQVMLSFSTDPYHPGDTGPTRRTLEILAEHGLAFCTLTKGGSRAMRDIHLFRPDLDAFASTLTSLDERFSQKWERAAALPADRIATLRAFREALDEIGRLEAAAQAELAALMDKEAREVAAAELSQDHAALAAAIALFEPVVGKLVQALAKVDHVSPELTAARLYLDQVRAELPATLAVGTATVERQIVAVHDGTSPIPHRPSEPTPAPPKPETRRVCPKQNLRYADSSGAVITVGRGWDCDLPVALSERAIARGLAVDPASDHARRLRFDRGGFGVAAAACYDLDDESAPLPKPVPRLPIDMLEAPTERDIGTARVR